MEHNKPSVKWFIETQSEWFIQNGIPEWFHGVITRKDAENLLNDKAPGSFLIRVGESRIGYSLSYRTHDRYRHFMIDVLKDQQCIVAGDQKVHLTLDDLVKFHSQFPFHPYNEMLTIPCGQKTNTTKDYEELFEDKETFATPVTTPSETTNNAFLASGVTFQPTCPPIPPRKNSEYTNNSSNLPPNQPRNSLYPSLQADVQMSNNTDFILPNRNSSMTKSYSFESSSSVPTAALDTSCETQKEEKEGNAQSKPLKVCRKAMTKAVSLMTEGEIAQDFKKMENAMTTHLRHVKENFGRFGQIVQKDGSQTQPKCKHTGIPEEYKTPPPFAPGFC